MYYSVLFRLFTIFNTVVIIHIHAEFYRGIWFSVAQEAHSLYMGRFVLIDVSFREPIQTDVDCSKISPFVCGNISTNSVAKSINTTRYPYRSLNLACSRKKFNFFNRFYYYSDSNIKVKFNEKLPSPPHLSVLRTENRSTAIFSPDGCTNLHALDLNLNYPDFPDSSTIISIIRLITLAHP